MYQTAITLAQQIRSGQTTSVEVVQAHLAQIKKHNPALNAVVVMLEDDALKAATECDREAQTGAFRGPLHGVPMTVKESYWVKGTPCTSNFKMTKDFVSPEDGAIVKRLKEAGAILIGKTNVPLNLIDYQVRGDLYPEASNPYNPARTPGGSSGGSAIALASGMTPLEMGTDFGGSIRNPAHFCGVYGLKPTEKTVSEHGLGPLPKEMKGFISHMAVAGPMARTVEDLELLWRVIRGPYAGDVLTPPIAWRDPGGKSLSDYKIAWVDGWPGYATSTQTQSTIKGFVDRLAGQGGQCEHIAPPNDLHRRTLALFVRLFPQLIAQGMPGFMRPLVNMQLKGGLLKGLNAFQQELSHGFKLGYDNYIETMALRAALVSEWEAFFRRYDVLICPLSFGPAYERRKIGTPITHDGQTLIYVDYVWPYLACFNASGHPAITIPLGLGNEGLPMGVQMVGPYWSEPELLHVAKLVSGFTPGFMRPEKFS